jgi:hypothetical protein
MNGGPIAKISESVLANLPFASNIINKGRNAAFGDFNSEVGKTVGLTGTRALSPEVLGAQRTAIANGIDTIADRSALVANRPFADAMANAWNDAVSKIPPGSENWKAFEHQYNQILQAYSANGNQIPGQMYRSIKDSLYSVGNNAPKALSDPVYKLKQAVVNAMDDSIAPADSAAWKQLNRQYFNINQLANAMKGAVKADGSHEVENFISPSKLLQTVNSAQPGAKFGAGNDLAALAQYGAAKLPDKIPNSGTAQRLWIQKLLTNPVMGAAELGGTAFGLNEAGISPEKSALGLIPALMAARYMGGKPVSAATSRMLQQTGGLLGVGLATGNAQ